MLKSKKIKWQIIILLAKWKEFRQKANVRIKEDWKEAKEVILVFFIDIWKNFPCFFGYHKYRTLKKYWTHVGGLDSTGINRRARTEFKRCARCRKDKIIVDVHNTVL